MKRLLALLALVATTAAHAQLTSQDNGQVLVDTSGLMVANDVGVGVYWENTTDRADGAAAYIAALNAENYGGYNNWTWATGDYLSAPNTSTNQLGQIFLTDCGNVQGTVTAFNNVGHDCSGFTSAIAANAIGVKGFNIPNDVMYISSTSYPPPCSTGCFQFTYGTYSPMTSSQGYFFSDSVYEGQVGYGDAVAVRRVPEIDPTSAVSAFTLLAGSVAMMRGRRRPVKPVVPVG